MSEITAQACMGCVCVCVCVCTIGVNMDQRDWCSLYESTQTTSTSHLIQQITSTAAANTIVGKNSCVRGSQLK